jgi:hypothetical protein
LRAAQPRAQRGKRTMTEHEASRKYRSPGGVVFSNTCTRRADRSHALFSASNPAISCSWQANGAPAQENLSRLVDRNQRNHKKAAAGNSSIAARSSPLLHSISCRGNRQSENFQSFSPRLGPQCHADSKEPTPASMPAAMPGLASMSAWDKRADSIGCRRLCFIRQHAMGGHHARET